MKQNALFSLLCMGHSRGVRARDLETAQAAVKERSILSTRPAPSAGQQPAVIGFLWRRGVNWTPGVDHRLRRRRSARERQ